MQNSCGSIIFHPKCSTKMQRTTRPSCDGSNSFNTNWGLRSKNFHERFIWHTHFNIDIRSRKVPIVHACMQSYTQVWRQWHRGVFMLYIAYFIRLLACSGIFPHSVVRSILVHSLVGFEPLRKAVRTSLQMHPRFPCFSGCSAVDNQEGGFALQTRYLST